MSWPWPWISPWFASYTPSLFWHGPVLQPVYGPPISSATFLMGEPTLRVGATSDSMTPVLRQMALERAAQTREVHREGDAVVFVSSPRHGYFSVPFARREDAVRYARHVDPRAMDYIAVIDVSDPSSPALLADRSFPS